MFAARLVFAYFLIAYSGGLLAQNPKLQNPKLQNPKLQNSKLQNSKLQDSGKQDSGKQNEELQSRIWSDSTGKHTVLAKFIRLDGRTVYLEKADQKVIQLPLTTLSKDDQVVARKLKKLLRVAVDFAELKRYESESALAKDSVKLYEDFINCQFSDAGEVKVAREILVELKQLASKNAVRINSDYFLPDDAAKHRKSTEALVVAAVGTARSGDVAKARRLLEKAERQDESSIHASYILAMTDAVNARNYSQAEISFGKCIARGMKYKDVFPNLKPNLAGALQNLATLKIRDKEFFDAIELYDQSAVVDPTLKPCVCSNISRAISMIQASRGKTKAKVLVAGDQTLAAMQSKLKQYSGSGSATRLSGWCFVVYESENKKLNAANAQSGSSSAQNSAFVKVGTRNIQLEQGCFSCSGIGTIDCSNRKCTNGTVRVPKTRAVQTGGQTQIQRIFVAEKCQACSGRGRDDCPNCEKGTDARPY